MIANTRELMCAAPPTVEHAGLLGALLEAARSDVGGEVIAKSESRTARIYTTGRRVAWVTASTVDTTLSGRLVVGGLIAEGDLEAAFAECKSTGANFAETLIAWELIDANTLRQTLLTHIAECLAEVFSWPRPTTMFVPCNRTYRGSLTFSIMELLRVAAQLDAAQATCLPDLLASGTDNLEQSLRGLLDPGERDEARTEPVGVQDVDLSAELRAVVDDVSAIAGARLVSILRGDRILFERRPKGTGVARVAVALAKLLADSRKACSTIEVAPPVEIALTTSRGIAIARMLGDGDDAYLIAILLEPDANQALVRHRLDKALTQRLD